MGNNSLFPSIEFQNKERHVYLHTYIIFARVPPNKFLKTGGVPADQFLKAGGVPADKFFKTRLIYYYFTANFFDVILSMRF